MPKCNSQFTNFQFSLNESMINDQTLKIMKFVGLFENCTIEKFNEN